MKKLLSEKLQIDHHRIELERADRTGKPPSSLPSTRPRPILTPKFLWYKDKLEVLSKAKALKGTNIFINKDFPEAVRQKRKELLPAMRTAWAEGKIAYLRYDKLIVHPPFQKPELKPKHATNDSEH